MTDDRRTRVAVVFGGRSSEHAISCVSAGSVLRALDRERYDVVPIGLTPDGRWVLEADDPDRLRIADGVLPSVDGDGASLVLAGDPTRRDLEVHAPGAIPERLAAVDVVFPVLHGPYGEDGTIQGLLEMAGIPYVGSGVLASAAAMDKGAMKALFAHAGLEQSPYVVITDRELAPRPRPTRSPGSRRSGLPVFVKPARAGSSLGITKVGDPADLVAAIEAAREHDPRVVVEASVEGAREIECGVLVDDAGDPQASVCAEIVVRGGHEFYDFEAKYLDDAADLVVPADLDPDVAERGPRPVGPRLRGARLRGAGALRLLPGARRPPPGQRGQHDAGVHLDLDVPAGLGGERGGLSRAWSTGSSATRCAAARVSAERTWAARGVA